MAANSTGVYQKDNGLWEYRFVMMVDGKQVNKKKSTDAFGNKLKTKRDAIKAREAAMAAARSGVEEKPKVRRRTFRDVYEEYCEKGRTDRAYQTIRKQESLWENHLLERFGSRYVHEISVAEVMDYLRKYNFGRKKPYFMGLQTVQVQEKYKPEVQGHEKRGNGMFRSPLNWVLFSYLK